jgi:hypothetical protein
MPDRNQFSLIKRQDYGGHIMSRVAAKLITPTLLLWLSLALAACVPVPEPPSAPAGSLISGVVTYGGQPVSGARVALQLPGWQTSSSAPVAEAIAGADGAYTLTNVPPGDYSLIGHFPDSEVDSGGWPAVTIAAGQTITDAVIPLEHHLKLLEPVLGAQTTATPTLRWEPFAEATGGYRVLLIDAGTTELILNVTLMETNITAPPLTPGRTYTWVVNAYAADNVLLASGEGAFGVAADAVVPPTPTPEVFQPRPEASCATGFEQRELKKPYQSHDGTPRYTLSEEALAATLADMGITSACIPVALGAPFLNVDWQAGTPPAAQGRMTSLGFEDLYPGAGWSDGYIVAADYDFAAGTEYETLATARDYDAVRGGAPAQPFATAAGATGLTRIQPSAYPLGTQSVFKTWVFPFRDHYVAVVLKLGDFPADALDAVLPKLQAADAARDFPPEQQARVDQFDQLARSLEFMED